MKRGVGVLVLGVAMTACLSAAPSPLVETPGPTAAVSTTGATVAASEFASTTTAAPSAPTTSLPSGVTEAPAWLGTRELARDANGDPLVEPTPAILRDRRFVTTDVLSPPPNDDFHSSVTPVPPEVLERSTWEPSCPVASDELSYVTVSFWGFDGRSHTGELIVNAAVADDVVSAFEQIFSARYPIEEMTITSRSDVEAPPTGDGNNTESFVCRPVTGGSGWSRHAFGRAIDINPFHNPYFKGDIVIPELAGAYENRTRAVPGLIVEGEAVTAAFDSIGWEWGGRWTTLKDYQHFSSDGR